MTVSSNSSSSDEPLRRGRKDQIQGLQSAVGARLRGKGGSCLEFNANSRRWGVQLSDGTSKVVWAEAATKCGAAAACATRASRRRWHGRCRDARRLQVKAAVVNKPMKKVAVAVDLEAAHRKIVKASECQEADDLEGALNLYTAALADVCSPGEPLAPGDVLNFVRENAEKKAYCHAGRGDWFECLLTLQQAKLSCQQSLHDRAVMLEAIAYGEMGLWELSMRSLDDLSRVDCEMGMAASEELVRARARREAIEKIGDQKLLKEEIAKLRQALPEKDACDWQEVIVSKCRSKEGQEECIANGFLLKEWLKDEPLHFTLRAMHRALLFQVKKKMQNASLTFQVAFASPESLRCGRSAALLNEANWRELRKAGLVVVNDVFDTATMKAAFRECELIDGAGLLRKDPDDLCNPDSRSIDIKFSQREAILPVDAPVLKEVTACMRGLAIHCEERLGLKLRVPQTVMLSCYGPGAYYRRHMDSYDGKDIPRKITILLYMNPYWEQSNGGCLRAWVNDEPLDFSPLAGRLIVFMSQDIPHEVLESNKDRYCLTQWIWDVKKDDSGR